jgi:hypothetical protein
MAREGLWLEFHVSSIVFFVKYIFYIDNTESLAEDILRSSVCPAVESPGVDYAEPTNSRI